MFLMAQDWWHCSVNRSNAQVHCLGKRVRLRIIWPRLVSGCMKLCFAFPDLSIALWKTGDPESPGSQWKTYSHLTLIAPPYESFYRVN